MQPETTIDLEGVLRKQTGLLPEDVKVILKQDYIGNAIEGVREIYGLDEETSESLAKEIYVTLLGLEFVSTLPERVEKITGEKHQEILDDLLESIANMLFANSVLGFLHEYEFYLSNITKKAPTSIPVTAAAPATAPQPVVPHAPEPIQSTAPMPKAAPAPMPEAAGKMVGFKKETLESTVKGMRTMRGDINRLRGPEDDAQAASFTKPFGGK